MEHHHIFFAKSSWNWPWSSGTPHSRNLEWGRPGWKMMLGPPCFRGILWYPRCQRNPHGDFLKYGHPKSQTIGFCSFPVKITQFGWFSGTPFFFPKPPYESAKKAQIQMCRNLIRLSTILTGRWSLIVCTESRAFFWCAAWSFRTVRPCLSVATVMLKTR